MASIIKTSINLEAIPKDKIFVGKKGKYLPITITINDELDQFGNQGPVVVEQTKEERDAKAPKTYLGNVKVENTKQHKRQMIHYTGSIDNFKIEYKMHLTG